MNLKELARSRGTNLKKIAEKCGIPASTLYAISSGDTTFDRVGITTFMKIAEALDMTPDELYRCGTEIHYAVVEIPKNDNDEEELVKLFRRCSEYQKESLLNCLRECAGDGVSWFSAQHMLGADKTPIPLEYVMSYKKQ